MWIVNLVAAVAGAIVGRANVVVAQEQLNPVRDNLSLPQVGLSVLSSLAAVVGALLKGELRAESGHKDVLVPLHAILNREFTLFTHELDQTGITSAAFNHFSNVTHSPLADRSVFNPLEDRRDGITSFNRSSRVQQPHWLWRLALWLETKGFSSLKDWCSNDSELNFAHACMVVQDTPRHTLTVHAFLHKMRLAWFKLNCEHVVRMVFASHPQDCQMCLEIPGLAWPGVLGFIPRESWEDLELADHSIRVNCLAHGGCSLVAQSLMEGSMGYTDHQRLALMFLEPNFKSESSLPKAFCSLDAVERNLMTEMAKVLVTGSAIEDSQSAGRMSWDCGRRFVALCAELILALILCWAAQMPPLSSSLVGRRLVRSYSTGAWANSTLFIVAGNISQVIIESNKISFFDISTSLPKWYVLVASLETFLISTAILAEYGCWTCVLIGVLPPLFGVVPKGDAPLAKACVASVLLALCFIFCILKSCNQRLVPEKKSIGVVALCLAFHIVSQVATWCIYVFATARLRVALLGLTIAGGGELMWLTAMWHGAHHPGLADQISWARTASHMAPYLTDAGASLLVFF